VGVAATAAQSDEQHQQTELRLKVQGRIFSKNKKEVFDYLLKDFFLFIFF